jgi:hypothetical protein
MNSYQPIQVIQIKEPMSFNKRTRTFIAELSELDTIATQEVQLLNPVTHKSCRFHMVREDKDGGGDIYGWHYENEDASLKLLLIND